MRAKNIALVAVLLLVIGSILYLEKQKIVPAEENDGIDLSEESVGKYDSPINPAKEGKYERAKNFAGINAWLNSQPLSIKQLQGKVVLVDFWTYSCINCIRTLPYLTAWDVKYRDDGLVIIGVHTPEFAFEKKQENVAAALEKYGIEYSVALDNDRKTWNAYQNHYWPHKYLIDKEGYIRYDHIGEGGYDETEKKIKELLAESGIEVDTKLVQVNDATPMTKNTPELYAGYSFALPRGQNVGNIEGIIPEKTQVYSLPVDLKEDVIYLKGTWSSQKDYLEAMSDGKVVLEFTARAAHVVVESESVQEVKVTVDGKSEELEIRQAQLYTLFEGEYGTHTLELDVSAGFRLHSFTFG